MILLTLLSLALILQTPQQGGFKPEVGQQGKDSVWVPTSPALTEKMLDMAKVTAEDDLIDLGSGDGAW